MRRLMATWVGGSLDIGVGEPEGGVKDERMGETLEGVVDGLEHVCKTGRTDRWINGWMGG